MQRLTVTLLVMLTLITTACKKKKQNVQCTYKDLTKAELYGNWKQYGYGTMPTPGGYFAYTTYKYHFYGDSFKREEYRITDALDSCHGSTYMMYAKGVWELRPNLTMNLNGVYTDASYTPVTSGCAYAPPFNMDYSAYKCNDTLVLDLPLYSSWGQHRSEYYRE